MRTNHDLASKDSSENLDWLKLVQDSVRELQFGVVQIVVHNAKVVQIEKTEKLRIEQGH